MSRSFPHRRQRDVMDCGIACLEMVAARFDGQLDRAQLEALTFKGRQGITLHNLCMAAEKLGFSAQAVMCSISELENANRFPVIVHWDQKHFVVVHAIKRNKIYVSDPAANGVVVYGRDEFEKHWISLTEHGQKYGVASIFEPKASLSGVPNGASGKRKAGLFSLLPLLRVHVGVVWQLLLTLVAGTLLTVSIPLLTQSMVDLGIGTLDSDFLTLVLLAQLCVFIGVALATFFRRWILVYLSARINLTLISSFFARLLRLPMTYFDRRNFGDLVERLNDHQRLETFLNSNAFDLLFTVLMLIVYAALLFTYNSTLFLVFVIGLTSFGLWVRAFLAARRSIDFKRFKAHSESLNREIELMRSVEELRVNTCESSFRLDWEKNRTDLYHLTLNSMKVEQWQSVGATLIMQAMMIISAFVAARLVISGEMTLGMMMAVSLILGQLSGPLMQTLEFMKLAQDASMGLERIGDVYDMEADEVANASMIVDPGQSGEANIELQGVSFRYGDPDGPWVLENLSLKIPTGKTTAIVGESGSGKTTLLKLLLRLYEPERGQILLGKQALAILNAESWRRRCGVVMQDGFIFSDSILRNVVLMLESFDMDRLQWALDMACANTFVNQLPLGVMTRIGDDGLSLSAGQKQRILIARALYKDPSHFLFDEATSALDALNESQVVKNLDNALLGKTKIVIAHRLSTVKNADKIVVMAQGKIVEEGTHASLVHKRGRYYKLVSEQLELAS